MLCNSNVKCTVSNQTSLKAKATTLQQKANKVMVKDADVPQAIKDYNTKNFADYKTENVFKVDTKGTITYEANLIKDKKGIAVIFDKNGKFLKKQDVDPSKAKASKSLQKAVQLNR